MNEILLAVFIALIQGITEWLPVSSSGHLVLAEKILGFRGGLMFQTALHFGTLMSVFVYFGKDITNIIQDFLRFNFKSENGRLGLYLLIASVPTGIFGFLLKDIFEENYNDINLLMISFAVTGLLLIIASKPVYKVRKLNLKSSFLVGFSQILALLPGISRSGTTISTGLILGLKEKQALKFSFLLSIPIIFGANILIIGNNNLPPELIWATLVSFIVGLITLHLLYKYVLTSRKNLFWFGIYTLGLSLGIGFYLLIN